jgi:hypothetical protein
LTYRKAGIEKKSLKVKALADARDRAFAWFEGEPKREERKRQERSVLTWEDWDAIQATHFKRREDRRPAGRTLEECRKAQRLFVAVTGVETASAVDVDLVGRFQDECLGRKSKFGRTYGKTTVVKTLSHLSASFNRRNRNAGRKCVRGSVPSERLLESNPFEGTGWVKAEKTPLRQFGPEQLTSFLAWKYLGGCPLVFLFAKVSLWGCGRLEEMTELQWDWMDADGYISIPGYIAKWGKERTVQIPPTLLAEIEEHRNGSPYVWAGYVGQLRAYHRRRNTTHRLTRSRTSPPSGRGSPFKSGWLIRCFGGTA